MTPALAHRHPRSRYYYAEPVLPGYGKLPRISLGTKDRRDAERMEEAIRNLARAALTRPELYAVLDGLRPAGRGKPGPVSAADVLRAQHEESARIGQGFGGLVRRLTDPLLSDAAAAYLAEGPSVTREDRLSLPTIERYAADLLGPSPRLGDLADARTVGRLLRAVERGEEKLPASVCRYEKRSLSKLLTWHLGRARRDAVFAEVDYSSGDDRRQLRAGIDWPAAIARLSEELVRGVFREGEEAAALACEIAAATGATVRPLLETRNADYHPEPNGWARLHLRGTKRRGKRKRPRDRPLVIVPALAARLAAYHRPHEPEAPLFPVEWSRFQTMFQKARKRAGLTRAVLNAAGEPTPLRPHDLRRCFAAVAEAAGLDRTKISRAGLGHDSLKTTDLYLRREVAMEEAEALAVANRILRPNL